MEQKKLMLSIFGFLCLSGIALSQEVTLNAGFDRDSVAIGEPVNFYHTAKYPRGLEVVFPDSTYDFQGFEWEKQYAFSTKSDAGQSYDSALYTLTTFEIDSIQFLSLPVWVVDQNKGDSIQVDGPEASIQLNFRVLDVPDSLTADQAPLITNTIYLHVPLLFNYPYWSASIILLITLLILAYVLFGKRVKRYLKIRKLNKAFLKFRQEYHEACDTMKTDIKLVERPLILWKQFLEKVEDIPVTTFTAKEIHVTYGDPSLYESLKTIEKAIYSQGEGMTLDGAPKLLEDFATNRFDQKINSIKNE